ncbi:unnamed protein product [Knipowitschia caucasica]
MSYILCRWLNEDLRISQLVEPKTFARNFATGYLIGEILHKYHLQNDLNLFHKDDRKSSKANNFSLLKPTLQMIGVTLDDTTARELMEGKQDVTLNFIYELYDALEKKKKGLIGGSVTDMYPNSISERLRRKEQILYSKKLHRGFDNSPDPIPQLIQDKHQLNIKPIPGIANMKRSIHAANTLQAAKAQEKQQEKQRRREKQALILQNYRDKFEENTKILTSSYPSDILLKETGSEADYIKDIEAKQHFNSEYIGQIRRRLREDTFTQKQRGHRASQFLLELSKARKDQQDAQIEESLVSRFTRQMKTEKLLVMQLLQNRSQKEEQVKNNLVRQQQFQQQREKDFREALEREAARVHEEKLTNAGKKQMELDLHNKLISAQKQKKYMKHFNVCKDIMLQIVDLASKAGDYRQDTGRLIPEKQMKKWKEFLFCGLPLYESVHMQLDPEQLLLQDLQSNLDYEDYENMAGEWSWPEEAQQMEMLAANTNILSHVISLLRTIMQPRPAFPHFVLKACVLGKPCSGKTTCLDKIAQEHGFYVLSPDKLIEDVLNAYHSKENYDQLSDPPTTDDQHCTEQVTDTKFTKLTLLGEAANILIKEEKTISNEPMVEIITEAIRQLPANSCWILDGFPVDLSQAQCLEKALGGFVEEVEQVSDNDAQSPRALAPALDLALILDVSDECVVSRAAKQTDGNMSAEISSRITAFNETWPHLEGWFGGKQNILVHLNGEVYEEELFKEVQFIMQQHKRQAEASSESSFIHDLFPSFGNEPLPAGLAASLCLHWDAVCELYVDKVKAALQELRLQSASIEQHLLNLRDDFKSYVNRTDPKKDMISTWQNNYNKICSMGQDKSKLEQRLDSLLEDLWLISDKRREENEQKLARVMRDEMWLVQATNALLQHHSTLMQVEVDRFQETLEFLWLCEQTSPDNDLNESIISNIEVCKGTQPVKMSLHGNIICDAQEAHTAISSLVLSISQQFTVREEINPCSHNIDPNHDPDVSETMSNGYLTALHQEESATKARIAHIKAHGLKMVDYLQIKSDQMNNIMEELMNEQFMAEMNSIEQVAEVARHHMESDLLQDGLDLVSIYSPHSMNDTSALAPVLP